MDSLLNNVSKNRDFFKILCILLLIDIPVITYFNSEMYFSMFKKINNNQDMIIDKTKIISGIIAYLLLAFGLYYFIVNGKAIARRSPSP
jgi:large-conductance mechanosensitive channel